MNTPELVTVAVLWSAAAYRGALAVQKPATWRTSMAVSVAAVAAATTAHVNRLDIDAALGQPNATNLGSRLALCLAVAGGQLYQLDTRQPGAPTSKRRRILLVGAGTAAISVIAWVAAPIHTVELADLADAPRHPASLVYAVAIYLYLLWFQIDMAQYAHRSYRSARATDPPAAAAVALLGASAWCGAAVLLLWIAHSGAAQVLGISTPLLDQVSTRHVPHRPEPVRSRPAHASPAARARPPPRRTTARVQLDPLWRLALRHHPHVQLPLRQDRLTRTLDPRLVAQRRLIEISDALEEHHVATARDHARARSRHRRSPRRTPRRDLGQGSADRPGQCALAPATDHPEHHTEECEETRCELTRTWPTSSG